MKGSGEGGGGGGVTSETEQWKRRESGVMCVILEEEAE